MSLVHPEPSEYRMRFSGGLAARKGYPRSYLDERRDMYGDAWDNDVYRLYWTIGWMEAEQEWRETRGQERHRGGLKRATLENLLGVGLEEIMSRINPCEYYRHAGTLYQVSSIFREPDGRYYVDAHDARGFTHQPGIDYANKHRCEDQDAAKQEFRRIAAEKRR